MRFDEEWLESYLKKMNQQPLQVLPETKIEPIQPEKRRKYGNTETRQGGRRFDSKHEAAVYEELRLRCLAGEYLGLGLQVPFYLPGGIKYIADFVGFLPGGGYVVMDAKSEATRKDKVYRLKKRQMKACLGLDIVEL